MAITLLNYFSEIERGIQALSSMYAAIERESQDDDLAVGDWLTALWQLQNAINKLTIASAIHRFERVTKDQMLALFRAQGEGKSTGKVILSIPHTLTAFDTLRSLELKYGVEYPEILQYNNLTSEEFETLQPGTMISIPVPVSILQKTLDIPVFGDQTGENILGRDLPNAVVEGTDGDLKVLEPRDSFVQAINNLSLSQFGDLPFYETYGLNLQAGGDLPRDAEDALAQINIINGFSNDPRIKTFELLDIVREQTALRISAQITPIKGEPITIPTAI